jgi:hypothetical protein
MKPCFVVPISGRHIELTRSDEEIWGRDLMLRLAAYKRPSLELNRIFAEHIKAERAAGNNKKSKVIVKEGSEEQLALAPPPLVAP